MKKNIVILFSLLTSILFLSGCFEPTINDYEDDNEENDGTVDIEDQDTSQPDDNITNDEGPQNNSDDIEEPSNDPDQEYYIYEYQAKGYCYNPEYPETGPSSQTLHLNWEELTGHRIKKQISCEITLIAEDDHYGSYSDEDTGDIFILYHSIYNKTTGEIEVAFQDISFPGQCGSYFKIHLENITGGVCLLPIYDLEISISNCGSYPKYWKAGLFSEPDPGNEWIVEIKFIYIPE